MTLVGNGIGNVTTIPDNSWVIIQNTIGFSVSKDKLSDQFLYYYLLSINDTVKKFDRGSGQPSIRKTDILDMEVDFPSLVNQQKIAAVLSALDSKIELNTKINNNLEQQAMTIFQQFFATKDPNGILADILQEMPKSKIKVGDAKEVHGPYPFFTSGQNIFEYSEALVDGRNVFLNTGGNADVKYYIGPASYSTDTWCIKAQNNMTDMLYLLLKSMQTELDSIYFEGSALRHLQKPKLKSLAIYIPSDEELKTFNPIVGGLFNKIAANVTENKILAQTRDALLPKLMSGEIDVSKVDISDPSYLDKLLFSEETTNSAERHFLLQEQLLTNNQPPNWAVFRQRKKIKNPQKTAEIVARATGLEPVTYGLTVPAIQRGVKFQFCRRFLRVSAN